MAGKGNESRGGTDADEQGEPAALWGFRPVPDAGTNLPTPCGTEEANEGDASSAGNTWAKRKFKNTTPMDDYDNRRGRLGKY